MKMRKCKECGIYTLKENCPKCNRPTVSPHPPSFSPEDRYGEYRRLQKRIAKQYLL